jgi:4-hydroxybenzoate polyprenyltransferase
VTPVSRLPALVRLVHPFPSILDGLVVGAVALLAGGDVAVAVLLGSSMVFLQFAIGALNDIVDAPADAGRIPPKPIPAKEVTVATARSVVLVGAVVGVGLAAIVDVRLVGLASVVLAIGAAYDLAAKGTPWSWLPFAVGIPVLPVYGWLGATGTLPGFFAVLIPMAVLAGAALAVANARADLDADVAAGTASVASVLGPVGSWWLDAGLLAAATAVGVAFVGFDDWGPATWALVVAGTALVGLGLIAGRGQTQDARRRGWEAQALGTAIAATGWVAAMTQMSF